MALAEENVDCIISYLDPRSLFAATAASRTLRRIALPHLWEQIDKDNLPARNIFWHILCDVPPGVEKSKARGDISHRTSPSDLELFQRDALRSTVLPLIRKFTVHCAASLTLLRLGEFNAAKLTEFALGWAAVKHDFDPSAAPFAVSLPSLRSLTIGLDDHYPPISFRMGMFPNDLVFQVVHQIAMGAPQLCCINLQGLVDRDIFDQIASIPGVEILDLSRTAAAGIGSMEDFRRIGDMTRLQHLVLPDNFRKWSEAAAEPPIQPPLLRKLYVRDTQVLDGNAITSFTNSNITHLHVDSFLLVHPHPTTASICTYAGLQHLHLYIHGWQWDFTLAEILERLASLRNLTSLRFLFEDEYVTDPTEWLTHTDAVYIGDKWPNLCSLGVSRADFSFFQMILDLPLLAELELNAYLWDSRWPTAASDMLPAMRALHFSGSPDRWAVNGARQAISAQFPGLERLVIISGPGPMSQRQAVYPDTSSEEQDDDE